MGSGIGWEQHIDIMIGLDGMVAGKKLYLICVTEYVSLVGSRARNSFQNI